MKKILFQLMGSAAVVMVVMLLFVQCASDATEMAQLDAIANISNDRNMDAGPAKDICLCLAQQYAYETPSAKEINALLFMREEEKLARDVYLALKDKWNLRVFSNISKAEQRHMDAVLCLIKKYELTDPVGNNPAGVFQNNNLQALYTALTAEGTKSPATALTVGAKIEDLDLFDLSQAMPDIDNADILAVFGELQKGSRNHLRAFVQNLERQNSTYVPVYISADTFADIIGTPHETGSAICGANCPYANSPNCNGMGPKGAGKGKGPNSGTCNGLGPNGPGTGPNGTCTGNGPNGNGNGPNGNGNGNGNPNGGGN